MDIKTFCKNRKDVLFIGCFFLFSRAVLYCLGVRFDTSPLNSYVQIIDPFLLRTRLAESLWYLHSQPPLFNLFLGAVLKLFPTGHAFVFNMVYVSLGLLLALSLLELMKRLGGPVYLRVVLTALFMVSPAVILYENLLFYSYPIAVFLCCAAVVLCRYMETNRSKYAAAFFVLLLAVVLTRAIFHVLWFLFIVSMLLVFKKGQRKRLVALAAVPLAVVFGLYLKNYMIVGSFSSGSNQFGLQMARMTIPFLRPEELTEVKRGRKTSVMPYRDCTKDVAIDPRYAQDVKFPLTGIPVLDRATRADKTHIPNFNSLFAFKVSRVYLEEGWYVLRKYPRTYLRALSNSYFKYVLPGPGDLGPLRNRKVIGGYEALYNDIFYPWYFGEPYLLSRGLLAWTCVIVGWLYFLTLLFYGVKLVCGAGRGPFDPGPRAVVAFMCFNIVYVTLIVNSLGVIGVRRYRFSVDAFFLVLLGLLLTRVDHAVQNKRPGQKSPSGPDIA